MVVTLIAAIGGTLVAWHYHRLGLTLSHYDARGHLIVARRIFDSITPGWQQIGAVWLPLPHLLNAIPVQIDLFYRTGASAVAISIASFAITAGAIAWIVWTLTASSSAALAAAVVFAGNPNVLYLQATPMTEPLLLATMTVGVAALMAWTASATPRTLATSHEQSPLSAGTSSVGSGSFALALPDADTRRGRSPLRAGRRRVGALASRRDDDRRDSARRARSRSIPAWP